MLLLWALMMMCDVTKKKKEKMNGHMPDDGLSAMFLHFLWKDRKAGREKITAVFQKWTTTISLIHRLEKERPYI